MGNFGALFSSTDSHKLTPPVSVLTPPKQNNFIKLEHLLDIFHTLQKQYHIDQYVIRNIFSYLIFCKDRFSPKHNWDKCRLAGGIHPFRPGSVRTTRHRCFFRQDKHWSFPFDVIKGTSEADYIPSLRYCPCYHLSQTQRDLLILENILELDSNYLIV